MNTNDPTVRLPIFISYGHQSHEETVLKIKEALEVRGHKIWIDTEGIREGTDWRRKIYDGILNSRLFLAFVSKKSVQSEYCQTEIRIAVGAPQNLLPVCPLMLENVEVPQSISHIQTVNFVYDENDPSAFEQKLKQIIDWIDLPEHEAFCREMEELREKLGRPESFEARLGALMSQPFVGRQWLLEKINEWDKGDSRLFGIIGGPGFGKSIFAANLRSLAPAKVAAAQFIEWDKTGKYAPKQIIKSLAFQLAFRITQYRELLIDAVKNVDLDSLDESSLFAKLLSEPLRFENPNNTYWVLLDALDEASGRDGQNPFVQTLMRNMDQLPKWLKFIVTSRPDAAVVTYLKNRGIQLFDTDSQIRRAQHDDMMEYLHGELKECRFGDDVLEGLVSKSQGMFLYLYFVCRDILQNHLSAEDISQMPAGIDAIYQQYFDRQFGEDRYSVFTSELRPILRLYCSALEPLPLDFIAEVLDRSVEDVRTAIDKLGTLKNYNRENGRDYFNLVHKSIWDWLAAQSNDSTTQTFRVAPEDGLPALKDFCLKKIKGYTPGRLSKDVNCEYPLKYTIEHLIALNDLETVWELLGGIKPILSSAQQDYWENSTIALISLRKAIAAFWSKYEENPKNLAPLLLPKISRFIVSFTNQKVDQQKYLRTLFNPDNSLEKTLKIMDSLPDTKTYCAVGCYLLKNAASKAWDIDALISALERRCKGNIGEFEIEDGNYAEFLGRSSLREAAPKLTSTQLIRILNIAQNKHEGKRVCEYLREHLHLQQVEDAYWWFSQSSKKTVSITDRNPDSEILRIGAVDDSDSRCMQFVEMATLFFINYDTIAAQRMIEKAIAEPVHEISSVMAVADYLYHTGNSIKTGAYIIKQKNPFTAEKRELYFAAVLCKYGLQSEGYKWFSNKYLKSVCPQMNEKELEKINSIFAAGASLQEMIDGLVRIPVIKAVYVIGCYLLKKAVLEELDVNTLVKVVVNKCNGAISELNDDERAFLANGPLNDIVQYIERAPMVELLSVIKDRENAKKLAECLNRNNPCFLSDYLVWHFPNLKKAEDANLQNPGKLAAAKGAIENIDSDTSRSGAKCGFAAELFTINNVNECKLVIQSLYDDLDGNESQAVLEIFLELCHFTGEVDGIQYYLRSRRLDGWLGYDTTLCKYDSSGANRGFEYYILSLFPDDTGFLSQVIESEVMLKLLAKSGRGEKLLNVISKNKRLLPWSILENIDIVEILINTKQFSEAHTYLDLIISEQETPLKTYRRFPKLLSLADKLKKNGKREKDVPTYQELADDFFENLTPSVWREEEAPLDDMLSDDFPQDVQLDIIERLWGRFEREISDDKLSSEKLIETIKMFGMRLARNPYSLGHKLNKYVCQYLNIIKNLKNEDIINIFGNQRFSGFADNIFSTDEYHGYSYAISELLLEALTKEQLQEFIQCLAEKMFQNDFCNEKINRAFKCLVGLCVVKGLLGLADELLNKQVISSERHWNNCDIITSLTFAANGRILPDGEFVRKSIASYNDDAFSDWHYFAKELHDHHEHPIAKEWAAILLKRMEQAYRPTDEMFSMLKQLSVFMSKEQLDAWVMKLDSDSSRIELQMTWLELTENAVHDSWIGRLIMDARKRFDPARLLNICINRGLQQQIKSMLSSMDNVSMEKALQNYYNRSADMSSMILTLKNNHVSEDVCSAIIAYYTWGNEPSWQYKPFDCFGKLAFYLVNQSNYIKKWFKKLSNKLANAGDYTMMKEIALTCPELGIAYLFEEPAVSVSIDDILELRHQLAEEEITRKGYNKKIAALLEGVSEDVKTRFEALEHQLDEEDVTLKDYAKKLAEIFPK